MKVSKPLQAEFKRVKPFEDEWKKRYNRDVEIFRALTYREDGTVDKACIHVVKGNRKYTISETLTKDGLTDFVIAGANDKEWKYRRYLDAEVHIADKMGEVALAQHPSY